MRLAKEQPGRLACIDVIDKAIDPSKHRTLDEQVSRCAYQLDIQGKGYSARLKLLLHSGRCMTRRPKDVGARSSPSLSLSPIPSPNAGASSWCSGHGRSTSKRP